MKIGIVHTDLNSPGGADAVCLNTIEALQDKYELHLITTREPDFEYLNEFFGTDASVENLLTPSSAWLLNNSSKYARSLFGVGLDRMQKAVLNRYVQSIYDKFDLIISTKNELSIDGVPTIQYFHVPQFSGGSIPGVVGNQHPLLPVYYRTCKIIGGLDLEFQESDLILSNSRWTANQIKEVYDTEAKVLYPPINPPSGSGRFEKRQDGFLCIGRIDPNKSIHRVIDILADVEAQGHDIHLHIIGPTTSEEYELELRKRASQYDWAHIDGELEKSELDDAIRSHKYGIHGREHEHFGISIAEMAMNGVLPFVPDSGGQREVVDGNHKLTYTSHDEAVNKISSMISSPETQQIVSQKLAKSSEKFERERFKNKIRLCVDSVLT